MTIAIIITSVERDIDATNYYVVAPSINAFYGASLAHFILCTPLYYIIYMLLPFE